MVLTLSLPEFLAPGNPILSFPKAITVPQECKGNVYDSPTGYIQYQPVSMQEKTDPEEFAGTVFEKNPRLLPQDIMPRLSEIL